MTNKQETKTKTEYILLQELENVQVLGYEFTTPKGQLIEMIRIKKSSKKWSNELKANYDKVVFLDMKKDIFFGLVDLF